MNIDRVRDYFLEGFANRQEIGGSVSVWKDGEEIFTLSEGFTDKSEVHKWQNDTIVPVFSATKGPSQCGLAGVDVDIQADEYDQVIAAIESQQPLWEPMMEHGYHPRLGGFMVDECVRRLTGKALGQVWREVVAKPLGIDFWIGLPESEDHRVATLYPGKMTSAQMQDGFYAQIGKSQTIPNKAFRSPKGVQGAAEMNKPHNWRLGYPAMGGISSARGLAMFYQAAMGFLSSPFTESMRLQFNERRVNGDDLVLCAPTSFGGGFMLDPLDEDGNKVRSLIGSDEFGFGHPGAGGSHAFADPSTGYSFAYVMNQMEVSVLPGEKVQGMLNE